MEDRHHGAEIDEETKEQDLKEGLDQPADDGVEGEVVDQEEKDVVKLWENVKEMKQEGMENVKKDEEKKDDQVHLNFLRNRWKRSYFVFLENKILIRMSLFTIKI